MFCLKWMLQSVPLWNSCPHLQCYFLEAPFFKKKFRWVKHPDLLLLYTPLQDSSAYSAESNLNVPWKKTHLKCQLQKQFSHRSVKYKHINSHLQTLQRHQMLHANMLMIGADYWLAWLYVNHLALPLRGWMKGSPLKKDEPSSPSCLGLLSAEVLPPGKHRRQRNHCNQHILNIIHIKTKGWDKNKGFLLVRLPLNF